MNNFGILWLCFTPENISSDGLTRQLILVLGLLYRLGESQTPRMDAPRNVCTRVSLSISAESSCCLLIACGTAHPTKPSSPSSRTAPEIPLTRTSTCFTCWLSAWARAALSQEHALSPDPAYGSCTWKKKNNNTLLCAQTQRWHLSKV